jgi:hypothetical protein
VQHAPCRSASHVACPPRLKPAKTHSPMVRSSFGNKYAGRMSMRKERSFTAPAAQEPKGQAVLPTPEKWHVDGFPSLSMPYMSILSVGKDIKVSEHLRNDWGKKADRPLSESDRPADTCAWRSLCSSGLRLHPWFPRLSTVLWP